MRLMVLLLVAGLAGCGPSGQPDELPAEPQVPVTVVAPAPPPTPVQLETPAQPEAPLATVVMEVMQVVGRSEDEVAALLGPPSSCADIHRARLCRYGPNEDEVLFARGKADMITVQAMDRFAFDPGSLAALGLGPATPDHVDEHTIRWESIPGLVEVALFPGPGNSVHYAYVKVGQH